MAHKFLLRTSNHIQVKRLWDTPIFMLPPFIGLNLCLNSFLVLTLQMWRGVSCIKPITLELREKGLSVFCRKTFLYALKNKFISFLNFPLSPSNPNLMCKNPSGISFDLHKEIPNLFITPNEIVTTIHS